MRSICAGGKDHLELSVSVHPHAEGQNLVGKRLPQRLTLINTFLGCFFSPGAERVRALMFSCLAL